MSPTSAFRDHGYEPRDGSPGNRGAKSERTDGTASERLIRIYKRECYRSIDASNADSSARTTGVPAATGAQSETTQERMRTSGSPVIYGRQTRVPRPATAGTANFRLAAAHVV